MGDAPLKTVFAHLFYFLTSDFRCIGPLLPFDKVIIVAPVTQPMAKVERQP